MKRFSCTTWLGLFVLSSASAADRPDLMIADFEAETYGDWKVEGEAFGKGPAKGTLPNQMHVSGFLGKQLVNSYVGGDKSKGKLTSPPWKVERNHLRFLIGGGRHPNQTCIRLVHEDKVVRTATGSDSETLEWEQWDVKDLMGKMVTIEIIDQATGGWGHINIDHILQTDQRLPGWLDNANREFLIQKQYLNFPVQTGAKKQRVQVRLDGQTIREFEIELAEGTPDFWAFLDVSEYQNKKLIVQVDRIRETSNGLKSMDQSAAIKGSESLYQEKHRPQFHFTSRRGWLNDPNGLVYFDGEWHLFYQHNPYGWNWGNMHWGHAVSKDLLHWQELPIALYPKKWDDWAFSGSAVVDTKNTSGFGKEGKPPLIAAYTSTGRGECIVYSNDKGRTWQEYDGNPVVKHQGRDPKLIWHEPSKQWVMAVYDEQERKQWIAFYTSSDLKSWTFQSRIPDFFECPDLFELAVDQEEKTKKWILYAANGRYLIGTFDGKQFQPETTLQQIWYGNFYAAQSYSDAPDGRRIQIGWGQGIEFPKMSFNQQMVIPAELTLRNTANGLRMFAEPIGELANLRGKPDPKAQSDCFDIVAEFEVGNAERLGLKVRGVPVQYDVAKKQITCRNRSAPLVAMDGKIHLRILVDRGSIEIFGNHGAVALVVGGLLSETERSVEPILTGNAKLQTLEVYPIQSVWKKGQ